MALLTDAQRRAVLDKVRTGTPVNMAAQAVRVTPRTIARWREVVETGADVWPASQSPVDEDTRRWIVEFVNDLAQAEAECFQTLVGGLQHNATHKNRKTGWYDTQAADKLLSKHPRFRQEWYENRQLQVTQQGTVSHEHRLVERMSEAEVLAAAGSDWELLAGPPSLPEPRERERDA